MSTHIRSWSFLLFLAAVSLCLGSGGCALTPGGSTVIEIKSISQEVDEGRRPASWGCTEPYADVYYKIISTEGQQIIYIVPAGSKDNHMLNNLMVDKTYRIEFYHNEEKEAKNQKYTLVKSIERIN